MNGDGAFLLVKSELSEMHDNTSNTGEQIFNIGDMCGKNRQVNDKIFCFEIVPILTKASKHNKVHFERSRDENNKKV